MPALQGAKELRRKLESTSTQERRARLDDAANEAEQALYHVLRISPPETNERSVAQLATRKPLLDTQRMMRTWMQHKTVEHVRTQLSLLVSTPSSNNRLQTREAKQQASIWASRYATHLIVLLLLFSIAALGGFKGLTVQAAGNRGETSRLVADAGGFADAGVAANFSTYDVRSGDAAAKADLANRAQIITKFPNRIKSYIAQEGDTVGTLAAKFNLDKPTIMWANHIADADAVLKPGDTLLILPVKGMYHEVQPGDTVESIAAMYQVEPAAITSYKLNGLQPPYKLNEGDALIVPGGSLPPRSDSINYIPHAGETITQIAQKFGLSVATLLLNNPQLGDGSTVNSDDELIIPPTDGLVYWVNEGDTIASVSSYYGINPRVLTDYAPNGLKPGDALTPGKSIVIPGGTLPTPTPEPPPAAEPTNTPSAAADTSSGGSSTKKAAASVAARSDDGGSTKKPGNTQKPAPTRGDGGDTPTRGKGVATGSFIWPTGGRLTQNFWEWEWGRRHGGLDIANAAGTPIVAADGGTVIWAGWRSDGFGYAVFIDHGNGYMTIYGHMRSQPAVRVGQLVARGQYIGPMGTTGNSTGNHVHFAIKRNGVLRDPLAYLN